MACRWRRRIKPLHEYRSASRRNQFRFLTVPFLARARCGLCATFRIVILFEHRASQVKLDRESPRTYGSVPPSRHSREVHPHAFCRQARIK